ncbi:MAG: TrbG/VirB9 family P-type conjugative transfer protein [Pseudomonadota bacterium]
MCNKIIISAIFLLSSIISSYPAQIPVSFSQDSRIRKFQYEEHNVYALKLFLKSVTVIQFAEGESVQSIVIGDSASWEIVRLKRGNVVSVKPVYDNVLTNMTIFTDRHVYAFELSAKGEIQQGTNAQSHHAFRIVFTYPEDDEEGNPVEDAASTEFVGGPINYNYRVAGRARFRPVEIRDDLYRTYFVLPAGAPRPAVFRVGPRGTEKLVNSRTDGQRIIVDGTSDFWVLRIGDEYICVAQGEPSATAAAEPPSPPATDLKLASLPGGTPPPRPSPNSDTTSETQE